MSKLDKIGNYRLGLGRGLKQVNIHLYPPYIVYVTAFLEQITLYPEDGGISSLQNISTHLHGVTLQKAAVWHSGNALNLYLGDVWFES
jgi:hypothetical protein